MKRYDEEGSYLSDAFSTKKPKKIIPRRRRKVSIQRTVKISKNKPSQIKAKLPLKKHNSSKMNVSQVSHENKDPKVIEKKIIKKVTKRTTKTTPQSPKKVSQPIKDDPIKIKAKSEITDAERLKKIVLNQGKISGYKKEPQPKFSIPFEMTR